MRANQLKLAQNISTTELLMNFIRRSHLIDDLEDGDRGSDNLPLIIRERDTEYQFKRIVLFRRLLQV